ncbi:MAG: hypothetical protein FWD61_19820, partial [Phycisphaerales bacterium]|nr:hypothetical protein [Phycisphaerales bacterium]
PSAPPTTTPTTKPVSSDQPAQSVFVDCLSYQDRKLVVKFHTDDQRFKSYVAANFTYPKAGGLEKAQVGQSYILSLVPSEAAHNVKKATLYDPNNPPKEFPDDSLIGKVVGIKETDAAGKPLEPQKQGIIIQFNQDQHVQAYYAKEKTFTLYNPPRQDFKTGDLIKISFSPDNRHTSFAIVPPTSPK